MHKKVDKLIKKAFTDEESKVYAKTTNFVTFFVFVSVLVMIAESMYEINEIPAILIYLEYFILILFSLDYFLNVYAHRPARKYVLSIMGLIDLVAILPSYFGLMNLTAVRFLKFATILRFLRFMRLLRMLRILKLSKGLNKKLKKKEEFTEMDNFKISLQIYFTLFFFVLIFFSTLMYYIEHNVAGSQFQTIPDAMWWCINMITGIGSVMEVKTVLGKIVSSFTMISGLILFGLLMNVIGKSLMVFLFGSSSINKKI